MVHKPPFPNQRPKPALTKRGPTILLSLRRTTRLYSQPSFSTSSFFRAPIHNTKKTSPTITIQISTIKMGNCCSKPSSSSASSAAEDPIPLTDITIPRPPRALRAVSQLYPNGVRVELPDDVVGVDLGPMSMGQRRERVRAALEAAKRRRESEGAGPEGQGTGARERRGWRWWFRLGRQ